MAITNDVDSLAIVMIIAQKSRIGGYNGNGKLSTNEDIIAQKSRIGGYNFE